MVCQGKVKQDFSDFTYIKAEYALEMILLEQAVIIIPQIRCIPNMQATYHRCCGAEGMRIYPVRHRLYCGHFAEEKMKPEALSETDVSCQGFALMY